MAVVDPLSVAVPTCNGAAHLAETLRSILAQTAPPSEILIVDDRSEDDTLNVARKMAGDRVRIEINSERLGLAGNWNRCAALSRTPWVAIFHQDDVMHLHHLASHRTAIREGGETLGMIVSAADVIDSDGREVSPAIVERGGLGPSEIFFPPGDLMPHLAVHNPIRCSEVTLRVAALQAVGGFDPGYRYVVDWDAWIRLSRSWGVAWIAEPTVAIRWHRASETHRFLTGVADLEETARLLGNLGKLPPSARRRLARAYLHRAYQAAHQNNGSLGRLCLRRAVQFWPGIVGRMLIDPRLLARLSGLFRPGG